jgi:hypothetical protein
MTELNVGNGRTKYPENRSTNTYTMNNPSELEVSIRKITFDGFGNLDAPAIGEIIREKLSSILLNYEYSIGYKDSIDSTPDNSSNIRIRRIDAGTFSLSPKLNVSSLGNETARSIAKALTSTYDPLF